MTQLLQQAEITIDRIEALAKQAFIDTGRDEDGDLFLLEDGVRTFVRVDTERNMITFFSVWPLRASISIEAKHELANKLNDDLIMVRFYVPRPHMLWCDFQFFYAGGVSAFQIINTYKRFSSICESVGSEENRGIVGRD
jgi:hypothetical protein